MSEQKYEIREQFLKEFIQRIFISYKILHPSKFEEPIKPLNKIKTPEIRIKERPITIPKNIRLKPSMLSVPKPMQKQRLIPMQRPNYNIKSTINVLPAPNNKGIINIKGMQPPEMPAQMNLIGMGLGKISFLLTDPSINSLECPGPEKPILINKMGIIQSTNIILTEDEINEILRQISEKTRIPIISGVFKAMFDRYNFTSVISKLVGTRFMIQKRNQPFTPRPH